MKERTKVNETEAVAGSDTRWGMMTTRRLLGRLKSATRKRQARYSKALIREQQEAA